MDIYRLPVDNKQDGFVIWRFVVVWSKTRLRSIALLIRKFWIVVVLLWMLISCVCVLFNSWYCVCQWGLFVCFVSFFFSFVLFCCFVLVLYLFKCLFCLFVCLFVCFYERGGSTHWTSHVWFLVENHFLCIQKGLIILTIVASVIFIITPNEVASLSSHETLYTCPEKTISRSCLPLFYCRYENCFAFNKWKCNTDDYDGRSTQGRPLLQT